MQQSVVVTIGAVLSGSLLSGFTNADKKVSLLRGNVRGLNKELQTLARISNTLSSSFNHIAGVLTGVNKVMTRTTANIGHSARANDQLVSANSRVAKSYRNLTDQVNTYNRASSRRPPIPTFPGGGNGRPGMGGGGGMGGNGGLAQAANGLGLTAIGMGGLYMVGGGLMSAAQFEQAQTRVRVQNMRQDGSYDPDLPALKKQQIRLGNQLPGSTEDFVNMDYTLRAMGFTLKDLIGGISESTANLAVVTGENPENMARLLGSGVNAFSMSGKPITAAETPELADFAQKMNFGAGVTPEALMTSINRAVGHGALKTGNYKGIEGFKDLSFMMAPLLKANPGSHELVGSNVGRLLSGITNKEKIGNANADVPGANLNFFSGGKVKDGVALVKELQKLVKLPLEKRAAWLEKAFGMGTDSGFAEQLGNLGPDAWAKVRDQILEQASIHKKMAPILDTFANRVETLGSNMGNLVKTGFTPLMDTLKPTVVKLGQWVGKVESFSESHKNLSLAATTAVTALFALAAAAGVAAMATVAKNSLLGKAFAASKFNPLNVAKGGINMVRGGAEVAKAGATGLIGLVGGKLAEKKAAAEATKYASASAFKISASAAEKAAGKGGALLAERIAAKDGLAIAAKVGAKGMGKAWAKRIPILSLLLGLGFGAQRAWGGDFKGAGLEVASGALSTAAPFVGATGVGAPAGIGMYAGSLAIDAGLIARDISKARDDAAKLADDPQLAKIAAQVDDMATKGGPGGGGPTTTTINAPITIHAAPGQAPEMIARATVDRLNAVKREEERAQRELYDNHGVGTP